MDRSTPLSGDRHFPTIGYYSIFNQIGDSENMEANNKDDPVKLLLISLSLRSETPQDNNKHEMNFSRAKNSNGYIWLIDDCKREEKKKDEDNGVWRWMCVTLE